MFMNMLLILAVLLVVLVAFFKATNTTQFDLSPSGGGTHVCWAMTGHNAFMAKAFSLFMNMDKVVGSDFEKGLAGLDAATAAPPRAR